MKVLLAKMPLIEQDQLEWQILRESFTDYSVLKQFKRETFRKIWNLLSNLSPMLQANLNNQNKIKHNKNKNSLNNKKNNDLAMQISPYSLFKKLYFI